MCYEFTSLKLFFLVSYMSLGSSRVCLKISLLVIYGWDSTFATILMDCFYNFVGTTFTKLPVDVCTTFVYFFVFRSPPLSLESFLHSMYFFLVLYFTFKILNFYIDFIFQVVYPSYRFTSPVSFNNHLTFHLVFFNELDLLFPFYLTNFFTWFGVP